MCPIVSFGGLIAPQMMIIGPWVLASQVNHMSTNLNYCKPQLNLTWTAIFSRIYLNQTLSYQFCAKRRTKKCLYDRQTAQLAAKGQAGNEFPNISQVMWIVNEMSIFGWYVGSSEKYVHTYIYIIQNRKCVQPIPIKWLIIPSFPMIVDEINRG